MVANSEEMNKKNLTTARKAAALRYDNQEDSAPKVVAKGHAHMAEKILEIAHNYDIPVYQDADLVTILEHIEVDQEIPLEVYSVVAEIFAYLYRINKMKRDDTP